MHNFTNDHYSIIMQESSLLSDRLSSSYVSSKSLVSSFIHYYHSILALIDSGIKREGWVERRFIKILSVIMNSMSPYPLASFQLASAMPSQFKVQNW